MPRGNAKASRLSGLVLPGKTTVEAPWKAPLSSLATAATVPLPQFLPTAASTLILMVPAVGGIQRWLPVVAVTLLSPVCSVYFRSEMKLSTKWWTDNGLSNICSWIAFRRACKIAQSLTHTRTRSSSFSVSIITASHYRPFPSSVDAICSMIASSSNTQTQRGIVHSSNAWRHISVAPHNWRLLLSAMFLLWHSSFVGIDCFARRHKNTLSFEGTLVHHNKLHSFWIFTSFELDDLPSNHASLVSLVRISMLYVDLTEKMPFLSWCQAQISSCLLLLSGISKIA
jgi:hypothetical protein